MLNEVNNIKLANFKSHFVLSNLLNEYSFWSFPITKKMSLQKRLMLVLTEKHFGKD